MIICEKCGTEFSEDAEKCPQCGALNPMFEPVETDEEASLEVDAAEDQIATRPDGPDPLAGRVDLDDELEQKSLVRVFQASDETTAMLVKGLLESEGIPVYVDSRMVPWMDGIMKAGEGYWGNLVVPESEVQKSKEIINAYHESAVKGSGEEG